MKQKHALGMIGMMMAMSEMGNIGNGKSMGGRLMSKEELDQWAKDKVAKEREERDMRNKNRTHDKRASKTKKNKFNVTYSKGAKPIFE